jgi:hypothetical protein
VNLLNTPSRIDDKGWFSGLGVGRGVRTSHRKKAVCWLELQRIWKDILGSCAQDNDTSESKGGWEFAD